MGNIRAHSALIRNIAFACLLASAVAWSRGTEARRLCYADVQTGCQTDQPGWWYNDNDLCAVAHCGPPLGSCGEGYSTEGCPPIGSGKLRWSGGCDCANPEI